MGRFAAFDLDLSVLKEGNYSYSYLLDNSFFKNIDSDEITKGRVQVEVALTKTPFENRFTFEISGTVCVSCDKCLDDVEIEVNTTERLSVKFGEEYAEEDDQTIVIPASERVLNLSWFIYEFVELALPLKRVHAPGKCNKAMSGKLSKHLVTDEDDDFTEIPVGDEDMVGEEIDQRWSKLREINIEND